MTVEELQKIAAAEAESRRKYGHEVRVCIAAGCLSCGADTVKDALRKEIVESGMQNSCLVKGVGCMGLCNAGPLVMVEPDGVIYSGVTADDIPEIVSNIDSGNGKGESGRGLLRKPENQDCAGEFRKDRSGT